MFFKAFKEKNWKTVDTQESTKTEQNDDLEEGFREALEMQDKNLTLDERQAKIKAMDDLQKREQAAREFRKNSESRQNSKAVWVNGSLRYIPNSKPSAPAPEPKSDNGGDER